MGKIIRMIIAGITAVFLLNAAVLAEEVSREQLKGLDEQVQEIKSDVLSIAAELNKLEEKLLYPSHTQVAVFVSLAPGETFRLDSVDISIGAEPVAHHIYTFKELEALRKGGVQRLYSGNIAAGVHEMRVICNGKSEGGDFFQRTGSFQVQKDVGPKIVEVILDHRTVTFRDR
jgi:hypothetical protein